MVKTLDQHSSFVTMWVCNAVWLDKCEHSNLQQLGCVTTCVPQELGCVTPCVPALCACTTGRAYGYYGVMCASLLVIWLVLVFKAGTGPVGQLVTVNYSGKGTLELCLLCYTLDTLSRCQPRLHGRGCQCASSLHCLLLSVLCVVKEMGIFRSVERLRHMPP